MLSGEAWVPRDAWSVLNCSLLYATYHTTIVSTHDRSTVSNHTIDVHDQILPRGDLDLQLDVSIPTSSKPNATDYGHLGLLDCLRNILGYYMLWGNAHTSEIFKTAVMFSNELVIYTITAPCDPPNHPDFNTMSGSEHFDWSKKY